MEKTKKKKGDDFAIKTDEGFEKLVENNKRRKLRTQKKFWKKDIPAIRKFSGKYIQKHLFKKWNIFKKRI